MQTQRKLVRLNNTYEKVNDGYGWRQIPDSGSSAADGDIRLIEGMLHVKTRPGADDGDRRDWWLPLHDLIEEHSTHSKSEQVCIQGCDSEDHCKGACVQVAEPKDTTDYAWAHSGCYSIAYGAPGWNEPHESWTPPMVEVMRLRMAYEAAQNKLHSLLELARNPEVVLKSTLKSTIERIIEEPGYATKLQTPPVKDESVDQCYCNETEAVDTAAAPDSQRGLYEKYVVTKPNGERVDHCFVLRFQDSYTVPALAAYVHCCASENPQLANDLLSFPPVKEIYDLGSPFAEAFKLLHGIDIAPAVSTSKSVATIRVGTEAAFSGVLSKLISKLREDGFAAVNVQIGD